jgi:hypothetical protein
VAEYHHVTHYRSLHNAQAHTVRSTAGAPFGRSLAFHTSCGIRLKVDYPWPSTVASRYNRLAWIHLKPACYRAVMRVCMNFVVPWAAVRDSADTEIVATDLSHEESGFIIIEGL